MKQTSPASLVWKFNSITAQGQTKYTERLGFISQQVVSFEPDVTAAVGLAEWSDWLTVKMTYAWDGSLAFAAWLDGQTVCGLHKEEKGGH